MSGVFGIADARRQVNPSDLAQKIARSVMHYEWIRVQSPSDEQAAIGSVGTGIFNCSPQPFWNSDHTIALVMAGEFYKLEDPDRSISRTGKVAPIRALEMMLRQLVDNDRNMEPENQVCS